MNIILQLQKVGSKMIYGEQIHNIPGDKSFLARWFFSCISQLVFIYSMLRKHLQFINFRREATKKLIVVQQTAIRQNSVYGGRIILQNWKLNHTRISSYRIANEILLPSSFGRGPLKLLYPKSKVSNSFKSTIPSGMAP